MIFFSVKTTVKQFSHTYFPFAWVMHDWYSGKCPVMLYINQPWCTGFIAEQQNRIKRNTTARWYIYWLKESITFFGLEQEGGSLITSMALAHPLHPIDNRSRNKCRNLWVGRCISSWWPWFPSRSSVLIYIYVYAHSLYEFCYRTYIQRECHLVLAKLHPITFYRIVFLGSARFLGWKPLFVFFGLPIVSCSLIKV